MSDHSGHSPIGTDGSAINAYQTVAEVAGDENIGYDTDSELGVPSVFIRAEFIGGDPTQSRVREVSVTVPMRDDDHIKQIGDIIVVTLGELARLGNLASYETQLRAGNNVARIEGASSPQAGDTENPPHGVSGR